MIDGSVVGTLVRLVVSLATVLILMVFLARYLRHRQLGAGAGIGVTHRRRKVPPMEVLTRQGLSRGSSLAVVRVSGQVLLLGVTDTTVSVLRELDDLDAPHCEPEAEDSPAAASGSSGGHDFAGLAVETLRQWTVRRG